MWGKIWGEQISLYERHESSLKSLVSRCKHLRKPGEGKIRSAPQNREKGGSGTTMGGGGVSVKSVFRSENPEKKGKRTTKKQRTNPPPSLVGVICERKERLRKARNNVARRDTAQRLGGRMTNIDNGKHGGTKKPSEASKEEEWGGTIERDECTGSVKKLTMSQGHDFAERPRRLNFVLGK